MKKVLTLVALAGMFAFVACGPSQEELEKERKRKEDSARTADSTARVEAEAKQKAYDDSVANAAAEKARQDSIRVADSLANLPKKGGSKPAPKPEPKKDETPKVGGGRPGATKK